MSTRSTVFAQILSGLDPTEFARCAQPFLSPRAPRGPTAFDQFLLLCFHQLTHRESLRDLVTTLQTRAGRCYHLGLRTLPTRSGLAYANAHRDWRTFAAVAAVLMRRAQRLADLAAPCPELPWLTFALDASLIELCLALCPWAKRQPGEASLKLHVLLNLRGNLPAWTALTEASVPDLKALALIPLRPGAYYIMDRGYLDFSRLARWRQAGAFFVVRAKRHVKFRVCASRPVDKSTGLRCDQTIRLTTRWSRRFWREPLRRVHLHDQAQHLHLVLLTNDFSLPAATITLLYQRRWQVELFFRWIKQHLRLRQFVGRSENAVRSQVWCAICAYLLVYLAKERLKLPQTLHQILQTVSVSAFEQVPLAEMFTEIQPEDPGVSEGNQLWFNDL